MIPTLLVGASGLLGGAVRRTASPATLTARVRWGTPSQDADLGDAVAALAGMPSVREQGWRIIWCAGRSVVASDASEAAAETAAFATMVAAARRLLPGGPVGRITVASSAGGIHAGSSAPAVDEAVAPAPLSAYGQEKLAQERVLADAATRAGWDAVAVRLGPLYGPGQDPTKPQGLVSALCRAVLTRRPVRLYVPPDTRRPYLWVGDAARIIVGIADGTAGHGGALRIRVVPGGPEVTVQQLVATVQRVTGRRPPVLVAPGPEAARHAAGLRLRTRYPDETVLPDRTPLTVGVGLLWRSLLARPRATCPPDTGPAPA